MADGDPKKHYEEDNWTLALSDTTNPEVRLRLLSYRVSVLTREKEDLETRVGKIENAFTMGKGVFIIVPILGTLMGLLISYGKTIFKPWQ